MANENARRLRKTMTPQEVKLWARLRQLRELGHHFRRQSPILSYIVDFECRKSRLIVEVDGGQHNEDRIHERDALRDSALIKAGYQVLRFWNHEIAKEIDAVMEVIHRRLEQDPPGALTRATLP